MTQNASLDLEVYKMISYTGLFPVELQQHIFAVYCAQKEKHEDIPISVNLDWRVVLADRSDSSWLLLFISCFSKSKYCCSAIKKKRKEQ